MVTKRTAQATSAANELGLALRQSQERFRGLVDLSSDAYWELDENLRCTLVVGATLPVSAADPKSYLGAAYWDHGAIPMGDGGSWDKHKAVLNARQAFTDFRIKRPSPTGEIQYISLSGQPMFDDKNRFTGYQGIARDISQHVQLDLRLAIEHDVTLVLESSSSIAEAAPRIIQFICDTLDWACGARWEFDEAAQALRCAETWGTAASGVEEFLAVTQQQAPSKKLGGLNRRAWAEGRPLWILDVTREEGFRRAPAALKAGLRTAFAFPVKFGAKVVGVFEFFSPALHQPDANLLECTTYIGSQIGQFVQRTRAEEDQRRFRTAIDVSADLVFLVDPVRMRYIDANETACRALGYSREELLTLGPQDVVSIPAEIMAQHYARMIAGDLSVTTAEGWYTRKDGSRFEVEAMRRAVPFGKGHTIVAVARDVGARKRQEQLLKLEHSVTRALAEAQDASAALTAVMRIVCETQGWELGRYVSVDAQAGVLRFSDAWGVPNPAIERYIDASRSMVYEPGVGVVGRVWQSGQPLWVADISDDTRVARSSLARETGMHGAFSFAVRSQGVTIGVLIFHSQEIREPDERLLAAVGVIGSQIGQFVQRKQAETALRESEARFRSLTQLSSDRYWEQDQMYRFTSMTGIGSQLVDSQLHRIIGKTRWELDYIGMTAEDWAPHIATLDAHQPFQDLELCRLDKSGAKAWVSVSGEPVFDASGVFKGYRGVGKDITARKLTEERIEHQARHDALTALPNRMMFSEMLNLALDSAKRYQRSFAVMFIDLDRFKIINDTLGHEAGDKLLQEIAARLRQTVRTSDIVARLGGDEFVILLQEQSEPQQIEAVARKLLSAVIKPLFLQGQECRVSASIGICMYPAHADNEQALMKNADTAMYSAKEEGKNTFKIYAEDLDVNSFERMALETSLRHALERNEFFLHYQAKLDLHTRQITGVEALVRWQHPELGEVPPGHFIAMAEETGLIVPLGKWVLNTACAQNVAWQRAGLPPLRMAVNLSARQFSDEDLLSDIESALTSSGMSPELLELELTESMVMHNADRSGVVLARIKQLGVRLAIDDFGVGYSSLTHLKRFPIDTLKIDRSFVRDLPQNHEDRAITQAIIAMGRSLNLTVVAEGVETLEQQSFLRDNACDESQGFLFSRAISGDQFAALLTKHLEAALNKEADSE